MDQIGRASIGCGGAGVGRYLTFCTIGERLRLLKLFEEGNLLRKVLFISGLLHLNQ